MKVRNIGIHVKNDHTFDVTIKMLDETIYLYRFDDMVCKNFIESNMKRKPGLVLNYSKVHSINSWKKSQKDWVLLK